MVIVVTGATGFIGRRLVARLLEAEVRVRVLARDPDAARRRLGPVEALPWDAASPPPAAALDGAHAVVNLAGEPIAGRFTEAHKRRARESRVLGTRHLVDALTSARPRPRVLVSASAVGYYGPRDDQPLDESAPPGTDFLAELCRAWEAEAQHAAGEGVRVVTTRTGIVLGPGGGALERMVKVFRLGLGGRLGSGRQYWPWVHLDDVVGIIRHAIARDDVRGAVNAVAPSPATNAEVTRALARALRRPAFLPAPAFALRALFGEFAEGLLGSQRVVPAVAERTGYRFLHPDLDGAMRAALSPDEDGTSAARITAT